MLKIARKKSHKLLLVSTLAVAFVASAFGVYSLLKPDYSVKAYLEGFDPGNIMSDAIMSNYTSISEAEIQKFLKSKNPCNKKYDDEVKYWQGQGYRYGIKGDRVLCMADDTFNGESAAHIIWQTAQDYRINPQVLIVLLEKEQSLVSDPWPNHRQYAKATGFACPDTGGCDAKEAGFKNQVRKAAALFRNVLDGGWSNYPAYATTYILYNPNSACGGTNVYIQNRATSALYRYTPYQPNAAALAAGTGTGNSCSSYGNRNFYNLFTNWFGSTHSYEVSKNVLDRYNAVSGSLGLPIGPYRGDDNFGWQDFENGVIVGSKRTGFWENKGSIRVRWGELGYQSSKLGLPTGPEIYAGNNTWWQDFENGVIIGNVKTGFWESMGETRKRWGEMGYQNSSLGYPTGPLVTAGGGMQWQDYQRGVIVGTPETGFWENKGSIRERWGQLGYQSSKLGFPTGPEVYAGNDTFWQEYENGVIIGSGKTGFWESRGDIRKRWGEMGYQSGNMGFPTSNIESDAASTWQRFENGIIIGDDDTGYWESKGAIRGVWQQLGWHQKTGNPLGPEMYDPETKTWSQEYEKVIIYYSEAKGGWHIDK